MKRLTLMRHAKSSWDDAAASDFDRSLNARGRGAAPLMGAFLQRRDLAADQVLCSSANRTRETCALVLEQFNPPPRNNFTEKLYLASPSEMLTQICNGAEAADHILMIAHNPGTHMLALDLADATKSSKTDLAALQIKFPTAAVAHFEFDIQSWREIRAGSGRLVFFQTPKSVELKKVG